MLHIEQHERVVVWTIDRPQTRNALDHSTLDALLRAVGEAARDRELRAAVLTGAGNVFVSGGDLRELRHQHAPHDAERLSDAGYELTSAIADLSIPVIAAIPGPAIGGGAELALACDLRVADARAILSFKQVRMGVTTAWGSVPRLVSIVGAGAAARLLYCGHDVSATEGRELGLVDAVTDEGFARTKALQWASDIALGSPRAIAEMKRLFRETMASARDVRQHERRAFVDTWTALDHREAVEAYFDRRPPRWPSR